MAEHISKSVGDNKQLDAIVKEVTERGNDVEIRHSKNGVRIYEVSKKLVGELLLK